MAEMTADLAMWMLNFSEAEAVIICAAVSAVLDGFRKELEG